MTSLQQSWYEVIVPARSSGSKRLASSVEPMRSQKTTVICRRSATALTCVACDSPEVVSANAEIAVRSRLRSPSGIPSSLRSSSVSWGTTSRPSLCFANDSAYCGRPIRPSQSAMPSPRSLPSVRRVRGVPPAAIVEDVAPASIARYPARGVIVVADPEPLIRLRDRQALRLELLGLSQLGHDLLRAVALCAHRLPPFGLSESANTTHRLDQMKGGRTRVIEGRSRTSVRLQFQGEDARAGRGPSSL